VCVFVCSGGAVATGKDVHASQHLAGHRHLMDVSSGWGNVGKLNLKFQC